MGIGTAERLQILNEYHGQAFVVNGDKPYAPDELLDVTLIDCSRIGMWRVIKKSSSFLLNGRDTTNSPFEPSFDSYVHRYRRSEKLKEYFLAIFRNEGVDLGVGVKMAPQNEVLLNSLINDGTRLRWWQHLDQNQMDELEKILLGQSSPYISIYSYAGYSYDRFTRELFGPPNSRPISLTVSEGLIIQPLIAQAPRTVPHQYLETDLENNGRSALSLKVSIVQLRRKLNHSKDHPVIITHRGFGYRFNPPVLNTG